jgi:hypothetical protein
MPSIKSLPLWQKLIIACLGCIGFAGVVAIIIEYFIS